MAYVDIYIKFMSKIVELLFVTTEYFDPFRNTYVDDSATSVMDVSAVRTCRKDDSQLIKAH